MIERSLLPVIDLLDELEIPYMVGGSVASSIHGEPRATRDVDLVLVLEEFHAALIAKRLGDEFYADEEMMRGAIRDRGSFNLIHESGSKIDVFLLPDREWDRVAFARRLIIPCPGHPDRELAIRTAEDVILKKLEWFRLGGEVSERQWTDVLGVLRLCRDVLDLTYVRQWAGELGIDDLLDQALSEASRE